MAEVRDACRDVRDTLLSLAISESRKGRTPPQIEAHLQNCEACRLYAAGLAAAPSLYAGASLYSPALKYRCLVAVAGANSSRDLKLGLLLAPPAALSLLATFLAQVYFVHLMLSKVFASGLFLWAVSFAAAGTVGAAAGGLCLALFWRHHAQDNRLQEVSHG